MGHSDSICTFTQVLQNNGDDTITINEVGIFLSNSESTTSNRMCYLISRTVLDTPIVFNPGDIKSIVASIDFKKFVDNTYNT